MENEKNSYADKIITMFPSMAPLITLLKCVQGKAEVCNPEFGWYEDGNRKSNYLQIFRNNILPFYTSSKKRHEEFDNCMKETLKQHLMDISYAFWYGRKEKNRSTTGGILYWLEKEHRMVNLKQDTLSFYGNLEFKNFIKKGFAYGGNKKILFMDSNNYNKVLEIEEGISFKNNLITKKEERETNFFKTLSFKNILKLNGKVKETKFGTIFFIEDKLLVDKMFLLDLESLKYKFLRNRDTFVRKCCNDYGADVDGDIETIMQSEGNEKYVNIKKYNESVLPQGDIITECGIETHCLQRCLGANLI